MAKVKLQVKSPSAPAIVPVPSQARRYGGDSQCCRRAPYAHRPSLQPPCHGRRAPNKRVSSVAFPRCPIRSPPSAVPNARPTLNHFIAFSGRHLCGRDNFARTWSGRNTAPADVERSAFAAGPAARSRLPASAGPFPAALTLLDHWQAPPAHPQSRPSGLCPGRDTNAQAGPSPLTSDPSFFRRSTIASIALPPWSRDAAESCEPSSSM